MTAARPGNWRATSASLRQRAWYYTCLTIDPTNADVVWFPQVPLLKTVDGGKTIVSVDAKIHGDHHDMWIDPTEPAPHDRPATTAASASRSTAARLGGTDHADTAVLQHRRGRPFSVPRRRHDPGLGHGQRTRVTLRTGDAGGGPTLGDNWAVGGGEAGDFVYDPARAGHRSTPASTAATSRITRRASATSAVSACIRATCRACRPSEAKYRFQWTRRSRTRRTTRRCSITAPTCSSAPPTAARPGRPSAPTSRATTSPSSSGPAARSPATSRASRSTTRSSRSRSRRRPRDRSGWAPTTASCS